MNFDFTLNAVRQVRKKMEGILSEFSIEQLNTIPTGFKNNLIWNYGHVIITQQLLCYKLAGQPMNVSKDLVSHYRKGSAPDVEHSVDEEGYKQLLKLSESCLTQFAEDYANGLFTNNYHEYTTSLNVTLSTVEEAFAFNLGHEGLHFGTMLALRKLV